MSLAMNKVQREAFLADLYDAVISVYEDRLGPLTVPVWHGDESGAIVHAASTDC